MVFRTSWSVVYNSKMIALLIAVVVFRVSPAIVGANEDLCLAAWRDDLPEVKRLIAKGAEVNAKNNDGSWRANVLFYRESRGSWGPVFGIQVGVGAV
ncbi:MAG: hypothetical protein ACLQJ7_08595 [Syntrophobacteraceae bacterium]